MLRDRPLVCEEFQEFLSTTGGSWAAQSNTQATPPTCQSAKGTRKTPWRNLDQLLGHLVYP